MWSAVVLVIMMTITGYYVMANQEQTAATQLAISSSVAGSMATYRAAVVSYFASNPTRYQSVDITTLKASGALPSWSTLYTQPETSPWANYRDTNGLIYVYASKQPSVNITADIAKLSQNSILTGVFRSGDTTLYSPVFGQTGIALPASTSVSIPDGSPVWIAISK